MKKLVSLITTIVLMVALIPSVFADKSGYVGSYYSLNSDAPGYAAMDIEACSDTAITLRFKREKNGTEPYTFVFQEGVVSGDKAIVPFTATVTSSGSTFDGAMLLEFVNGMVKVHLTSSQRSEMYSGLLPKVNRSYFADSTVPTPAPVKPAPQAAAAAGTDNTSYDVSVSLNGAKLKFDESARPLIRNNFTYVPLRSVFSSMGINVYWDDYQKNEQLREQLITCTKNDTIIQFARTSNETGANVWTLRKWDGSYTSFDNYSTIDITMLQPIIINNRSYVPLRVISESLGADVSWDDTARTVVINCDTSNAYWYNTETIGKMEDYSLSQALGYITADFTSVSAVSTPYFNPQSKFYQFSAKDSFGDVTLRVYYGGYIDVIPASSTASTPSQPETSAADNAGSAATEAPSVPADPSSAITSTTVKDENGEDQVVTTFDMTQLLNGSDNNGQ